VTNRLSFWIAVSVAFPFVVSGLLLVLGGSPAFLALIPVALLQAPLLLAVLLLARAIVLRARGADAALRVGNRSVLAGAGAIVVPLLFLGSWTLLREAGIVSAQLSVKRRNHQTSTMTTGWLEGPARQIPDAGLVVSAPPGSFGDAFARELRHHWSTGAGSLHGEVKFAGEPPTCWLPLYKFANVEHHVEVELQMHRPGAAIRSSSLTIVAKLDCSVVGLASNRDFQEWLGSEFGEDVRKAIDTAVRKADQR